MTAVSRRADAIAPSATMSITDLAARKRARGEPVISLSAGEPDFATPEHIIAAATAAMHRGETRYTAVDGTPALKEAIARKFRRDHDIEVATANIIVSNGAKHSLFNALTALLDPGDEVCFLAPYWVSYSEMARLLDATPRAIPFGAGLEHQIEALAGAVNDRTRVLLLNSPNNPSGSVLGLDALQRIAKIMRRHPRLVAICDDIYEQIHFADEPFHTLLQVAPDLADRIVTVNGVSKAYAMTGFRIGYAAAPDGVASAMRKIQSQTTSGPCSVSQAAAAAALDGPQDCVIAMREAYRRRRDRLIPSLNALPGFQCPNVDGAFYAFPNVGDLLRRTGSTDDVALAEQILSQANVALVPGTAFGAPNHLRLAFAVADVALEEAVLRLSDFVEKLLQESG